MPEGKHGGGDGDEGGRFARIHGMEDEEPEGDIEQSETYHHEAHHGTAAEGNLQSLIET